MLSMIDDWVRQNKVLDRYWGSETTKDDGSSCNVYPFVCQECDNKCKFVMEAIKRDANRRK